MADAPVCPICLSALRRVDFPGLGLVARYVGVELLFWTAAALLLGYLAAPRGEGEWYAGLAVLAIAAWLLLRPGQLAARRALAGRARYHCEHCNRHFDGEGPWPSA